MSIRGNTIPDVICNGAFAASSSLISASASSILSFKFFKSTIPSASSSFRDNFFALALVLCAQEESNVINSQVSDTLISKDKPVEFVCNCKH